MFSHLTKSEQSISKRRKHTLRYKINMEDVPLAITSNTVNKGKKFLEKEQVLDSEDEEPHHHTRLRTRVIAP